MKIALLGNPNTGKSSVFNSLTGLRQHISNFPGVTVEVKKGSLTHNGKTVEITDFPGTYSIYPRSLDEEIVYKVLADPRHTDYPDLAVVVADATNLERNLFLFTQIYDLGIPSILVLNMADVAERRGKIIDTQKIEARFPGTVIVQTNARIGLGMDRLKNAITAHSLQKPEQSFVDDFRFCPIDDANCQGEQATLRYERIHALLKEVESVREDAKYRSSALDRILVHPVWGYLIFAGILLVIFQFIFSFANYPMDLIDEGVTQLSTLLDASLPPGILTDLLVEGIVPGVGGIVIFVPQIALLFFFISLLEESGYLARVVFIMDRLMRPLGLNGKSVVPLMSSVACAIPGVMAARVIPDWKERLTTILVAPLMSCSARIPVYTLLIAMVIPERTVWGIFNLQGLVFFGLYFLGLFSALIVAFIIHKLMRSRSRSFLIMELPSYKLPRLRNVGLNVLEKVRLFVTGAGKIILAISIILWALAKFGPGDRMETATAELRASSEFRSLTPEQQKQHITSVKLENSYIGILGKGIEPVIRPLGYDWKIGIALITSFAAREVFVGSLATIYSVHDDGEENHGLIERMKRETFPDGTKVYSLATGVSLMVFYVYAMQCMATLAVVRRETRSWKWPVVQVAYLGVLAYLGSWISYMLLS